ncbi:PRC-barrel domain-containing protein [Raoultibacter phocaeensis]|uniref:PRC-barrel domain-containing protein n=1 Tax=Raoultibacter phocaeensis TaxID=2479841 RepID=UPI0015D59865|nr:PRC-barrel domain-containing protein [Raoultibacter phocaeensis]
METNESILTKGVVSIDDRKQVGKVKGVIVDCDSCGVSHYIISSSSTNSSLVLPFEKSLAVGDTFMTIQSRDDFLATTDLTARGALEDNFDLVGLDVYSRAGSHLGVVKGFDIDTAFGGITKIDLEDGGSFESDSYVFFAREFVFVDDGTKTDADIRSAAANGSDEEAEDSAPLAEPADEEEAVEPDNAEAVEEIEQGADEGMVEVAEDEAEEAEIVDEVLEQGEEDELVEEPVEDGGVGEEPVEDEAAEEAEAEEDPAEEAEDDPDAELRSFLVGKVLNERVVSQDGSLVLEAGEEITEQVFADAQKCDAVLLLTMSVDE